MAERDELAGFERWTRADCHEHFRRDGLDPDDFADVLHACDGIALAVREAASLCRTMRGDRVASAVLETSLGEIRAALADRLEGREDAHQFLLVAWLPLSFDAGELADVVGVSEPAAARMLSGWLDVGLVRPSRAGPARFRVPRPLRAAARMLEGPSPTGSAGELVVRAAEAAQRALWGPDGGSALATLRSIADNGLPLMSRLHEERELAHFARISSALLAEPFANLLTDERVQMMRDADVPEEHELRYRAAIELNEVHAGRANIDELVTLAAAADAADDELTVVLVAGQLGVIAAERDFELPHRLTLRALANRVNDPRLAAFARIRLASAELARGRPNEARALLDDAIAVVDEHQVVLLEGYARNRLAQCWFLEGHAEQARRGFEAALQLHRDLGQIQSCVHDGIDLAGALVELGDTEEALYVLDETIELARTVGAERLRLGALLIRGMTYQLSGRLTLAEAEMQTVLAIAERLGERRTGAVAATHLAEMEIVRGDWEAAHRRVEKALDVARQLGSDYLEVCALLVAIPIALVRGEDSATAAARFRELVDEGGFRFLEAPADAFDALRLAWRTDDRSLLDEALARLGDTSEDAVVRTVSEKAWAARPEHLGVSLVVHREGLWFEGPDGPVDLRRRRAPRILLVELAKAREEGAGVLTMSELFDAAWEGEAATPESAAQRVYTAVWTLRKMGLEDRLEKRTEGYLLTEDVRIVWSDDLSVIAD